MTRLAEDHWPVHARQWDLVGAPLRPSAEDLVAVGAEVRAAAERNADRPTRVLLLGVTPEIATLSWPRGTRLVAVDRCEQMIENVWPRAGVPDGATAIRADWRSMPLDDGAFDLVVGDGCCSVFPFPGDYRVFAREIRRVLAGSGRLVLRVFAAPPVPEELGAVVDDLWAGRIGNFHVFKWRLAMCLEPSPERGVVLGDIWDAFARICPDASRLTERLAWAPATVRTIEAYRGSDVTYTFPDLAALRGVLAEDFVELGCHTPSYELGDRCPTLVLSSRGPPGR